MEQEKVYLWGVKKAKIDFHDPKTELKKYISIDQEFYMEQEKIYFRRSKRQK
jgi:hypothetical protein